jgi:hypothetical protein
LQHGALYDSKSHSHCNRKTSSKFHIGTSS